MLVTLFINISSLFIQELSNFADTVSCMSESVGQTFRSAEEVSFPLSPLLLMKNSFYDTVSSGSPCYNDLFLSHFQAKDYCWQFTDGYGTLGLLEALKVSFSNDSFHDFDISYVPNQRTFSQFFLLLK